LKNNKFCISIVKGQKGKRAEGLIDVNFWRSKDKAEFDLIILGEDGVTPVEVKFSTIKKATVSKSFRSFIKIYSPKKGYVVNRSYEESRTIGSIDVSFVPFWKFVV